MDSFFEIISGMRFNIFSERQKRITIIKFFGELYCYEIIDTGDETLIKVSLSNL